MVTYLTISNCSKYLVVGDPRSNIVIYTIKQNKWVVHAKLPKHLAPPTSIAINSKSLNVVVAYSDNKVNHLLYISFWRYFYYYVSR